WSIAGGEPTNNAVVALNTAGGFSAITIAPGIKLGQLIFLLRTAYTTIEYLKQMAVFGQLMQENIGIEEFSAKIKKYNIRMIAKFNDTQDNITEALAETEKFILSQKNNSKKSSKKKVEDIGINHFLSDLLKKNPDKHPADEYNHDPIEDISDSLVGLTLNSVIKTAVK
ncbi:16545_t:CDS:2, partial [Racocetra persica]